MPKFEKRNIPNYLTIIRLILVPIIFALIFSQKFASTGIWMAWPFGWLAATGLTIFFYRKVLQKMLGKSIKRRDI